jgi:CubicO group peptidase (beta-lactamase class C family)
MPLGASQSITWAESLAANYTDGIVVLHKGRIVYERYFGVLKEDGQHGAMSVTKSFVGTLGAMLVAEGVVDAEAPISEYVLELSGSGFGDATVRQVLDMTTAIKFSEDYSDPNAEVWAHAHAGNPLPKSKDYTGPRSYYEFLQTVKKQGNHGEAFGYKTANTDALGWVIARVTGRSIAQLVSERIWRRLGAEQDAYFSVDSLGTPFAGGGFNTGLRDLARFGEMIRNSGSYNGQQIVPAAAIEDTRRGGDRAAFVKAGYNLLEGWSYRNMWWITHNEHGAFGARGVHGQRLYIDPKAEMVIARFASHPVAGNAVNDPTTAPAFHALAKHLLVNY